MRLKLQHETFFDLTFNLFSSERRGSITLSKISSPPLKIKRLVEDSLCVEFIGIIYLECLLRNSTSSPTISKGGSSYLLGRGVRRFLSNVAERRRLKERERKNTHQLTSATHSLLLFLLERLTSILQRSSHSRSIVSSPPLGSAGNVVDRAHAFITLQVANS